MWIKGNDYVINLDTVKQINWNDTMNAIFVDGRKMQFEDKKGYTTTKKLLLESIGSTWNLP